ncbi:MAG: glycoside hydrolase/phage tail family protein [Maricaulaceae bacterium]
MNRADAYKVSHDAADRPVFGGTPSDNSILQAIDALKSRGFSVTLYPFILMDIDENNTLTDPYSGTGSQPVFPWRGRITCDPAPARAGTVDQTLSARASVESFMGTAQASDFNTISNQVTMPQDDFGFRRFILHYAHLAKLSGGVDNFLIGSELRGLTQVRDDNDDFPFVEALAELAQDVRTVLGANAGITYAADWSEYFGYHPQDGSGDVFFHLDPLWSHPAISAVGIDSYIPLSDWRDGEHLDGQNYDDEYSLDYLQSNVLGGEGYDWFYASQKDRASQTRTPIMDGLNNQDWVFRFKDMQNWWSNPHYNRKDGVVASQPTAWSAQSKPIWLTELGCPAIDKGGNQPNVFVDPKSSESFTPYFSNGNRDDLIQRRYIEAYLSFWDETNGKNLLSTIYNGPMIDLSHSSVWTWDARPFPDFPSRNEIWADGENWRLGHWLTGRTGLVPLSDVVDQLAQDAGLEALDVSRVSGLVEGYVVDRPMTARAALEPLSLLYGFNVIETAEALRFVSDGFETITDLTAQDIVDGDENAPRLSRTDSESDLLDVRLQFIDGAQDYQLGSFSLRNRFAETVRVLDISVPMVLSRPMASWAAETLLEKSIINREAMSFAMSPQRIDLEVGDIIRLPDDEALWRIESLRVERAQYEVRTIRVSPQRQITNEASFPETLQSTPQTPRPFPVVLDVPHIESHLGVGGEIMGPLAGVRFVPFSPVDISIENSISTVTASTHIGVLSSPLTSGPVGRIDRGTKVDLTLLNGVLSSLDDMDFLAGGHVFAVETELGWELLSAQAAELIGNRTYRLSNLIRGLAGTDADMMDTVPAGSQVVRLSGPQAIGTGLDRLPLSNDLIGSDVSVSAVSRMRQSLLQSIPYTARHLRPLSPVHGVYNQTTRQVSWIRRTRLDGDNWTGLDVPLGEAEELYELNIYDGDSLIETHVVHTIAYELPVALATQATHITIAQGSNIYGFGPSLNIPLIP